MQPTVRISDEQARAIAEVIIPDIKTYIAAHPEEYAAFLKRWKAEHGEAEPCS